MNIHTDAYENSTDLEKNINNHIVNNRLQQNNMNFINGESDYSLNQLKTN